MADKTPAQGSTPLQSTDRILYKELSSGTYGIANGAVVMVGTNLVSASNPLPTTAVFSSNSSITPTHTARQVNGDTQIIVANANRMYLLIVNNSDTDIYLNLGGAAVVNTGIPINSNGGKYEISAAIGNLYLGAINANHSGGAVNKLVLLTEGV